MGWNSWNTNSNAIIEAVLHDTALNQEALRRPARRIQQIGCRDIWRRPLADGSTAVVLVNRGSSGADVNLQAVDVGRLYGPKQACNLWQPAGVADVTTEIARRVKPHQTIVLKISGGGLTP